LPIVMNTCSCGNVAEEDSAGCARCNALQALELKADASTVDIENASEVLTKAWSPDRFEDGSPMKAMAEEKLKAINAAYLFLMRGSVQSAPFRSEAAGERTEAPIDAAPKRETKKRARKARKLGYNDGTESPLPLPMPLLIGCGVVVSGVVVAWLLFKPLDSALMRIPVAGKVYAAYKTSARSEMQELKNKAGIGTGANAGTASPDETVATEDTNEAGQETDQNAPPAHQAVVLHPGASRTAKRGALPFITAGLSKSEVIATQGAPTAETGNELDYGSSKLYFNNGALVGWKITAASPIRAKLWPDAMVDPNLRSFGVGSTKNEVLVVQGTPTFFSEDAFGYGGSEVYFKSGHVVSWKSDPGAPLRTSPR
jgi:hypothetical protein